MPHEQPEQQLAVADTPGSEQPIGVDGASATDHSAGPDADPGTDGSAPDSGAPDSSATDSGATNSGATDSGATDSSATDSSATDSGAPGDTADEPDERPRVRLLDAVVALCRRRGFVFPSGEIYGDGAVSGWDHGPLGVELAQNIRRQWWKAVVTGRDDVVGLDSAVLLPPQVLAASGHAAGHPAPNGAVGEAGHLRPEAAQGHFVNFANVMGTARCRPPFGIGQIGRVFRECTTGCDPTGGDPTGGDSADTDQRGGQAAEFLYRTREFDRMELTYFVDPDEDEEWHTYWVAERTAFYTGLGIAAEHLRPRERPAAGVPQQARSVIDIEYRFPLAHADWGGLEAVANRSDFDLNVHSNGSGVDLSYFDHTTTERYRPYCIGTAAGVDRAMLAFLLESYTEDDTPNAKGGTDRRVVLRLDRRLAPVKVAVLPLSRNAELSPRARTVATALRRHWVTDFDDSGSIGRRYRRQDEIGTPFCVTVDFDSLADDAVTVRDRDSLEHWRVPVASLEAFLAAQLVGC